MILILLIGGIFVMLVLMVGSAMVSELLGMIGFVIAGIAALLYGLFKLFTGTSRRIARSSSSWTVTAPDPQAIYRDGKIIATGRDLPADRLSRAERPIFGEIK